MLDKIALGITLLLTASLSSAGGWPAETGTFDEEIGGGGTSWNLDSQGRRLDVSSTRHRFGHAPTHSRRTNSPAVNVDFAPKPEPPTHALNRLCAEWTSLDECIRLTPPDADPDDPEKPATPTFTITDLASFAPAPVALTGEPENLGVAGLATNFIADAADHTRSGTLFGYAITARFTPTSFVFHYGDSSTRRTGSAGASWQDLGLAQFTPTDTSHTYAERGTYSAHVDTAYTAEIDLGTGFFPIAGTLTIPGMSQEIRIYEARTALVAHTCTETPSAPGC
ncbi:hypothetical protein [Microbacterium soli]|uniref:PKD domain-containing protein n=1 Tax=Microbacterium soli TaxID=446075 RepID=A0ABP7NCW7_9MICO